MKNKKTFEEAAIEVVRLNSADIICTSGCNGYGGNNTEYDCLSPSENP